MSLSSHPAPPFSPVLLAGLMLRPLPTVALHPLLRAISRVFERRHPEACERLGVLRGKSIVIDPVDLPFCLTIVFAADGQRLRVADDADRETAAATVHGPLLSLIELMEGRLDGDALFFSRELTIEGDTEAVLVLRNALDGADIDIVDDLTAGLGPLARPAALLAGRARAVCDHLARDFETLYEAVVAPLARRSTAQEATIRRLEERVAELESHYRRPARRTSTTHGR